MSEQQVFQEIERIMFNHFDKITVDTDGLKELVSSISDKQPEFAKKLPEILSNFIGSQRGKVDITYIDVSYLLEFLAMSSPEHLSGIKKALSYRDSLELKGLNLLDLIKFIQKDRLNELNIPEFLARSSYQFPYTDPSIIPRDDLDRGSKLLLENWHKCNSEQQDGLKFLFEREIEAGNFRKWLEEQSWTKTIQEIYAKLGLKYERWDNPSIAYGFKNGNFVKIETGKEEIFKRVKDLAIGLLRGQYTGFLIEKPNKFWKKVEGTYKKMNPENPETMLSLLDTLKSNVKPEALRGKSKLAFDFKIAYELLNNKVAKEYCSSFDFFFNIWAREPSKDFYQGNDSGICTSFYGSHGEAILNYLVDKSIAVIDIKSNHNSKRCGQIYFVATYDLDHQPVLVLDSLDVTRDGELYDLCKPLYECVNKIAMDLAKDVQFKKLLVNGNLYWRHSSGFLDYMMHKHDIKHYHKVIDWCGESVNVVWPHDGLTDFDFITLSKVGGITPIKMAFKPIMRDDFRFLGRKHYFDLFSILGQEDYYDWKDNLSRYKAKGILLEVK